jgi:CheY-like chemotaxis protein/HPt (histidine-containing phosphotransfer) domain-containing protein
MLGKPIRTLRLQQGREGRTHWRLPGRTESLEFPITPTRITRRLLRLLQDQRDVPDEPLRPPVRSTPAAAASVLLVEDNWAGQVYARRVLERDGHHVSVASTGHEALAQTQAQKFDVILMDLMLPDANGFEVTRQIRQAEQARGVAHTPILALTAHALETFRQEALAAGMDDYLTKPVRPQTLLDAIAHWAPPARPAPNTSSPPAACFEVDPDLADLVPLFLEKVRQQAAALAELAAQKNFAEIAKLGHNWKGTGSLYGFHPLSQLGRKLEEAAHAQDLPAINQLAEQLLGWLQDLRWQPRREH